MVICLKQRTGRALEKAGILPQAGSRWCVRHGASPLIFLTSIGSCHLTHAHAHSSLPTSADSPCAALAASTASALALAASCSDWPAWPEPPWVRWGLLLLRGLAPCSSTSACSQDLPPSALTSTLVKEQSRQTGALRKEVAQGAPTGGASTMPTLHHHRTTGAKQARLQPPC